MLAQGLLPFMCAERLLNTGAVATVAAVWLVAWLEIIGARVAVGEDDEEELAKSCFSAAAATTGVAGALAAGSEPYLAWL